MKKCKINLIIIISLMLFGCGQAKINQENNNPEPTNKTTNNNNTPIKVTLTPAQNWQKDNHTHGLNVDLENPEIVYIATHKGLIKRTEKNEFFWMGKSRDDFMGFTIHPGKNNVFYSSGHSPKQGELGLQISTDGGETWQQLALKGEDFHAIAIAPSNPNIMYGFVVTKQPRVMISQDGGKTWQKTQMNGLEDAPFNLVVNPNNYKHIYATTRFGIYQSIDQGENWQVIPETKESAILGLTLAKNNDKIVMYGYRFLASSPGIYRSDDQGKIWQKLADNTGVILYMAIAPTNSKIIYGVNAKSNVFKSEDGGLTWKEL
jgi:photosystem II stability/assembly factor-like uncharacterized protein